MNNEPITGTEKWDKIIYTCFQYISPPDVKKFKSEFKVLPINGSQFFHTFYELVLGAYLWKHDIQVHYKHKIDSKTPDWCILDNNSQPESIIECTYFHLDARTSIEMGPQLKKKRLFTYFPSKNTERLYDAIQKKARKYKSIIKNYDLPYVISVFGDFLADVKQDELKECLFHAATGLFKMYPNISGLLYFEAELGKYLFTYYPNPCAKRTMVIQTVWFLEHS